MTVTLDTKPTDAKPFLAACVQMRGGRDPAANREAAVKAVVDLGEREEVAASMKQRLA